MARRVALGLTLLALACGVSQAVVPVQALAGNYHVYSCALPNGRPAPTDGWSGSITGPFMNHLYVNAACGGAQGWSCPATSAPYMVSAQVFAADITLHTESAPSASAVGGSLLTAQVLNGPQSILITASDPGPGVYRAIFQVDGKEVSSSVLDNNGGRCESVGGWART